jgi:hypothetical protein
MDYKDEIISEISVIESKKISNKVIRNLQKLKDCMLSGDDTILKNVWDEVCVQVQYEESWAWDAYIDTIRSMIKYEVEQLSNAIKKAIWIQTEEGFDWVINNEEDESIVFSVEDIIEYILHNYVLSEAADWTNKRIEKYLERECD